MGMKGSNQLGKPNGDATTIFLRQGQIYTEVGDLTALFAKAKSEKDYGGGLFSMTFNEDAYKEFAEGQEKIWTRSTNALSNLCSLSIPV